MFRLIHFALRLEFADKFKPQSIRDKLYEALGGSETSPNRPAQELPFSLRSTKEKQFVGWSSESCIVLIESITNYEDCIERTLKLIEVINKIAPLQELKRRQLTTHWILPAQKHNNFASLEKAYRSNILIDRPVWNNFTDSSFICDLLIDGIRVHHQSGAMTIDELNREHASFKTEGIPDLFLFLLVGAYNEDIVQYNPDHMGMFINAAYKICDRHRELFEDIWEGII